MASKSKSRRRVFRASCILAALIVAGSSFAWFSSKDEVTNRLSASANYGVSIVEDFQPPKNFLPGQKVNKDVAVVNTGNVDAFVRAWIDGEMSVVKREANGNGTKIVTNHAASNTLTTTPGFTATAATQTKLTDINLNWYDTSDNTKYYKELSQKKSENPKNSTNDADTATETAADKDDENIPADFTEVQSVQAGGVLVYHADNAEYYYVLEQATTITNNASVTATYPAGTYVCTPNSCVKDETGAVIIPYNYYGEIDTSQFFPESEGLYLFRRNVELANTANATDDYEYTGYYFFQDTSNTTTTATGEATDKLEYDQRTGYNPVYLALEYDNEHTQRSDYVLRDTDVTTNVSDPTKDDYLPVTLEDVRLFTAKEHILKSYVANNAQPTYTVDGATADITKIDGDTGKNVGGTVYMYQYVDGTDTYYGVSDSGTFYKYDSDNDAIVGGTKQVVKGTQEALTWNFDAGNTTYTITDGNTSKTATGAPTQETAGPDGGTVYVWKITAEDNSVYWSNAVGGTYYAASSFTNGDGTPGSNAAAYSVSSTPGTPSTGNGILYATYGTGDEQIRINVQLANLDNAPTASTAETWSVIEDVAGDNGKWTFYYNNDVEEGATTTKLIDSVELDKLVKDEAYLAFDFDLNVFMESAQVVIAEDGSESGDPIVTPWTNGSWAEGQDSSANTNYNKATATTTVDGGEITVINWA